ncbi:MAG: PLP-dependent aminotransferase family protein [Patulibacter sp.]|nr:PLP-dependent aminotransferase family protein [Patulibacter sp.]
MRKDQKRTAEPDHPAGRPAGGRDLAITLTRGAGPLHRQLEDALRAAIRDGRLTAGEPLPATRTLAADLDVSRGVVVEAYAQLVAEAVLQTVPGGGTRVGDRPAAHARAARPADPLTTPRYDLRPFVPELSAFPRRAWIDATARALRGMTDAQLALPHPTGDAGVRATLARYSGRARGVRAHADDVVVTSGSMQSIRLVGELLRRRAERVGAAPAIAVEAPGFPLHRLSLEREGLRAVSVPADAGGLRVDALPDGGVDAVLVTPAHQFPLGGELSAERRAALIGWATTHDAIVIEDDYDGEYRYAGDTPTALQADEPDRVVYLATASKTLATALRLGWMVVPPALRSELAEAKLWADGGSSALVQQTLAALVVSGAYDRHVRRSRDRYRRRRGRLLDALAVTMPDARTVGAEAGLHLTLRLPDDVAVARIWTAAADESVALMAIDVGADEASGGDDHQLAGPVLLVGFGNLPDALVDDAAAALGRIVTAARSRPY